MRALLVTAMKNEGPFILEWVAYHRAIGFTDILVYWNDCADGTDAILARLQALGFATQVENAPILRRGVQKSALKRAGEHPLRALADWVLVADVDEFVCIKTGAGQLTDLMAAVPDATAFALTWRRFGDNAVAAFADAWVTEQFTRAAPEAVASPIDAYGYKTLFRDDGSYARFGVHRPLDPDPARMPAVRWVNGDGAPLPPQYRTERAMFTPPPLAGYGLVQLNHYALRSAESFLIKRERGPANTRDLVYDLAYWAGKNFNQVTETAILARLPAARALYAEMMADAVLADLHAAAVAWHRARIRALLTETAYRELYLAARLTETRAIPLDGADGLRTLEYRMWHQRSAERTAAKARSR